MAQGTAQGGRWVLPARRDLCVEQNPHRSPSTSWAAVPARLQAPRAPQDADDGRVTGVHFASATPVALAVPSRAAAHALRLRVACCVLRVACGRRGHGRALTRPRRKCARATRRLRAPCGVCCGPQQQHQSWCQQEPRLAVSLKPQEDKRRCFDHARGGKKKAKYRNKPMLPKLYTSATDHGHAATFFVPFP